MTKKQDSKSSPLLPVGFYDLLFDEAEMSHKNINIAIDNFLQKGYRLIKLPLVEFEDNFSSKEVENSFRATDVISGRNLLFRNDITLQISRLLNSRLKYENLPLKLCYVGDVLCAKIDNLYADRQQTQVGVEIIGCDAEKSEFEIIESTLGVLEKMNVENLLIEFCLTDFLETLLSEANIKQKEELREAIMKKNISAIKNLAGEFGEAISAIALVNNDLEVLSLEVAKLKSQKLLEAFKKAQKIAEFLKAKFSGVKVCFDLFGDHESSYHNQISFDIFSGDFSYPIACGGRYKINDLDAVGATVYMNRLRRL